MILLADNEGPDQTARMRWLGPSLSVYKPEDTFPHGVAHLALSDSVRISVKKLENTTFGYIPSLSPDSIYSIIFSLPFKGIQSSTLCNNLISYVP